MLEKLSEGVKENPELLKDLIRNSYSNLSRSIKVLDSFLPPVEQVIEQAFVALNDGYVMVTKVNSEHDVEQMLDENGQLRLRNPLNIFIGGQILDRGITIGNLLGFYYGRRPNKFQQDTVLQHSRMYGFRPKEDLAVTRFYTTLDIYQSMKNIHEFDEALRESFLKGSQENSVVFIRNDSNNKIIPCSPNKILLSTTKTLKPFKTILPIGLQTQRKGAMKKDLEELDDMIGEYQNSQFDDPNTPFLIDLPSAKSILKKIEKTFTDPEKINWDWDAFKSSMEYLSRNSENEKLRGKVWCLVKRDRNTSRTKKDGTFSNSPYSGEGEKELARNTAIDIPMILLFRQNSLEGSGWNSPFWWPVLMAPEKTKTVIYVSDTSEFDENLIL